MAQADASEQVFHFIGLHLRKLVEFLLWIDSA